MKIISFNHKGMDKVGVIFGKEIIDLGFALKTYYSVNFKKEILIYNNITHYLVKQLVTIEILNDLIKWLKKSGLFSGFLINSDDKIKFHPPIKPGKIIALGRNYVAHAKEQNAPVPKEPILFEKANSSVIGHNDNIVYKKFLLKIPRRGILNEVKDLNIKNARVDHEVELAIVIGKRASNIKKKDAFKYVFGYTILNDITARNLQAADFKMSYPWFRSKSIDTFCPIGPWIVTCDDIKNPHNLNLSLKVNGKIKQSDNTKNMLFKIPYLIEYISMYLTLEPGDIISTGTPEGISPIYPGDIIEAKIDKIGILKNKVISEK